MGIFYKGKESKLIPNRKRSANEEKGINQGNFAIIWRILTNMPSMVSSSLCT